MIGNLCIWEKYTVFLSLKLNLTKIRISFMYLDEQADTTSNHLQEDFEQNRRFLISLPTPYEIVYPVQLRKNEEQGLSTRDFYGRHKVSSLSYEICYAALHYHLLNG